MSALFLALLVNEPRIVDQCNQRETWMNRPYLFGHHNQLCHKLLAKKSNDFENFINNFEKMK